MIRIGLVLLAMAANVIFAQPVRAPRAQALIDDLLRAHPEIQTIGLHVTPPGWDENLNIACSKLGKVGKRSAAVDMAVIATGKPSSRMANRGAFDIGVPIGDARGKQLGMIVVVLPANRATDSGDAMRQVLAIRDELQGNISSIDALFAGATLVRSPLTMVGQTPLPAVRGGFELLAVDLAKGQLLAIAHENQTTEVFDLAGEFVRSEPGVAVPMGLLSSPGTTVTDAAAGQRIVADAGGKVHIVDLKSGREIAVLAGAGAPGDLNLDRAGGRLFLSGGDGLVVYRRDGKNRYAEVARFGTMGGKRSLYLAAKKLLYVIHAKNAEDGAGLQVYEVKD